jgi:hypothetical protein
MPNPDAPSLHETMLEMIHEARRRGMSHNKYSLGACDLLLEIHAPGGEALGSPCAGCLERWPCSTVLGIIGGLGRVPEWQSGSLTGHPGDPSRSA